MSRSRRPPSVPVALAVLLAMASGARAEQLLTPVPATSRALPAGVAQGRALRLGQAALSDLRGRATAVVPGFPLGNDADVELTLKRFTPFSPTAHIEVVDDAGVRAIPLPDATYFTGGVSGDPRSRALLVADAQGVHGFVVTAAAVFVFGPDGNGGHRSYALRDADPAVWPPPGDFCGNDLHPEIVASPTVNAAARVAAGLVPPPIPRAADTTMLQADVAVETDHELWDKFDSDQGVLDYLGSLLAADTAIYERDVAVRLRFSYIRLWASAADPWTKTSTSDQLDEVQGYWTNPSNNMNSLAGPHDMVHFVSGKSVQGGIAYIGSVCDPNYQFGVSQVFGSFDLSSPSQIWDVLVTSHEMGHNLGTPHTHCYANPPIDKCYNQEPGCYNGPVVASRGTIMSYCHLLSGGLANIDLVFGDRVSAVIRDTAAAASCLQPAGPAVCGNGIVETGEQCDDGNTVSGDGCSATCQREPRCGDGVVDPGEQCDDRNTVSGDGCSATCQREPRCGDGTVDPGEQCDDGNTTSGDGCSATCQREKCKVTRSGQTVWGRSLMTVQRGKGGDRFSVHATFDIPVPVASLSPPTTGIDLALQNGDGSMSMDASLPPGSRWSARKRRWIYKDPTGSVAGIRNLEIVDQTRGGVAEVDVVVTGRNASYAIAAPDLPLTLTIVLGDETAGLAGACGRHDFSGGSCNSARGGARFICR